MQEEEMDDTRRSMKGSLADLWAHYKSLSAIENSDPAVADRWLDIYLCRAISEGGQSQGGSKNPDLCKELSKRWMDELKEYARRAALETPGKWIQRHVQKKFSNSPFANSRSPL